MRLSYDDNRIRFSGSVARVLTFQTQTGFFALTKIVVILDNSLELGFSLIATGLDCISVNGVQFVLFPMQPVENSGPSLLGTKLVLLYDD